MTTTEVKNEKGQLHVVVKESWLMIRFPHFDVCCDLQTTAQLQVQLNVAVRGKCSCIFG